MSSHCGRYPKCGCSEYVGNKCHLSDEEYVKQGVDEGKKLIDGLLLEAAKRSEDMQNLKWQESLKYEGKKRNKMKHLTPKKKKRK